MTAQSVAEKLSKAFGWKMHVEGFDKDMVFANMDSAYLPEAAQYLTNKVGARFMYSVGSDSRERTGNFDVTQVFGLDEEKVFLSIRTDIDPAQPEIPSLASFIPGANWHEREVRDMIGVTPFGHPDPRRLVLPDDWPDDVHPLRRDFQFDERPEHVDRPPELREPPEGTSLFPIGPFYPTLEEPVFVNLFVSGERIVDMDYRGFYAHRGIEKLGDAELTYQQVPYIAERICGI